MQITLRKASQLSEGLLKAARGLPISRSLELSIYSTLPTEQIKEAKASLDANIATAMSLQETAFAIRQRIAVANYRVGISDLLTEKAKLDANEKLISGLSSASSDYVEAAAEEIAMAKLDALRVRSAAQSDRYGVTETLNVNIIDGSRQTMIQDRLVAIRRRKSEIADELLHRNMDKKIALEDAEVKLLTEFKLI